MKRTGVILILWLLLAVPLAGQDQPQLASLKIALWPEYDRPEVLVILQGAFAPETALPVSAEFRIPARVAEPSAVAYLSQDGRRLNQPYTTRVEGETLVVTFELDSLAFQLEYYDALPIDAEGRRAYTLSYTADYRVQELTVEVQQPPDATDLALDPPLAAVDLGADGLRYHTTAARSAEQGETLSWQLGYVRSRRSTSLTAAALAQAQATPAPQTQPAASQDSSAVLIFAVAFVALVAVGAGAFWLGRSTRPPGDEPLLADRRASSRSTGFCARCGADLRLDSAFCHKCGHQVRPPAARA